MSHARSFLTLGALPVLALGILAAWSAAHAQQAPDVVRIGILSSSASAQPDPTGILAYLQLLGYVHEKDFVFEYRSAGGKDNRLPELAAELLRLKVAVIVPQGRQAILAAKAATRTIPGCDFSHACARCRKPKPCDEKSPDTDIVCLDDRCRIEIDDIPVIKRHHPPPDPTPARARRSP